MPGQSSNAQAIDDGAEGVIQAALIHVAWPQRHEQRVIVSQRRLSAATQIQKLLQAATELGAEGDIAALVELRLVDEQGPIREEEIPDTEATRLAHAQTQAVQQREDDRAGLRA